ncbi:MAG: lysylphosphatidylglycerol synthase transmembrane domain-containing protein, partial [Anaerolineales bacterium]
MGGIGYFMARARRRGHPLGRAASAAAMYLLFDYFAALVVITLGLVVLLRRHQLSWGEVLAAVFLAAFAGVIAYLLVQAMRSANRFADALAGLTRFGNRLLRPIFQRDHFDVDRARDFAADFSAGLERARRTPGGLLAPMALALTNKALLLTVLFLVFLAFQQPPSTGTVIAAFGIGSLFAVVSPTPGGLSFVEGAMTLVVAAAGIPLASATVITLAYRGITFWFPLVLGFFALRWTERTA